MNKIQKQLELACPVCASAYQLLEIHEIKKLCAEECWKTWEELLSRHYQECIILNLAEKEAQKEVRDE